MQYNRRAVEDGRFNSTVVAIAQLVEPRIVIPVVEGSSPFSHPIFSQEMAVNVVKIE